MTSTIQRMPTLFVPHGAGPCFFMDWTPAGTWSRMEAWLRNIVQLVGAKPRAIVVVSGHWEATTFAVNAQRSPQLLYDYSGFPESTYHLTWPAPGSPELASRVRELLNAAGIQSVEEHERGLDHGVFIPMKLAFPDADIPVVQLSLRTGLEPAEHIALGRALAALRDEGVLIIGSGMSFHNIRTLRAGGPEIDPSSKLFDRWLSETVARPQLEREQRLVAWSGAPGARAAHPREEHLLPLHVVAGAAGADSGERIFRDEVLGSVQSGFWFGGKGTKPSEKLASVYRSQGVPADTARALARIYSLAGSAT